MLLVKYNNSDDSYNEDSDEEKSDDPDEKNSDEKILMRKVTCINFF